MPKPRKNTTLLEAAGARRAGRLRRRDFFGAALGGPLVVGSMVSAASSRGRTQPVPEGPVYRESLQTPIAGHYQVVVAGGGPSGFIAALAAVRSGAKTLLIERYPFLGGNGTAGLMTSYNGFRNQRPPEALQTVKGIPAEYIAELVREGGLCDDEGGGRSDMGCFARLHLLP
jgi:NADPH-dependent 2,4-dienoyl-CoA reductase/sulfur reductase-like enzyme